MISHRRMMTLILHYHKLNLLDSTAMVALKIALRHRQGHPLTVRSLHLMGPVEHELKYLRHVGLIGPMPYYSVQPLYRALDGLYTGALSSTKAPRQTVIGSPTVARMYLERALSLLGECAGELPKRRRELLDWQLLGEDALGYLFATI